MIFSLSNVGIDIGSKIIKVILFKKGRYKYYSLLTPEGCVNKGRIVNVEKLSDNLGKFLRKNRISGQLCFVLTCSDIIIREISLPKMDELELKNAVKFEASKYIPVLSNDYIVDYRLLNEIDNKLKVLLVACPKVIVDGYISLAAKLKMKIKAIDIFPNSVIKAINFFKYSSDVPIAVIDLGHSSTKVLIVEKGIYGFYREIPFGSQNVLLLLANKYDIDLNTADKGILEGNYEVMHMDGFFESLLLEIDTVFNYYYTHFRKEISCIYLSGGFSNVKGLDKVIKDYFNMEVNYFLPEDRKYILPSFGAALRG